MHSAAYKNRHPFRFVLPVVVMKHSKYKIMAPTENSMALKTKKWPLISSRVKHNNGSIRKSLLLCGIISYLLLSYIGKLYINPCLNGWAMLSQNFSILAQTVSEIWHKMYPKNGPFCALCCCTWNFTLFLNYVTHIINWNLSFGCIYWIQKLLRIILMFSLLKLIKNCGSYDQRRKFGNPRYRPYKFRLFVKRWTDEKTKFCALEDS